MTIDPPPQASLTHLEGAILRTVLYAGVFNFPMTVEEIHHFLICDEPVMYDQVAACLRDSATLRQKIILEQGYVVCTGSEDFIRQRSPRDQASQHLWPQAVRYGRWLARLPFVRMVAITGALAMRNAGSNRDDLDYLLVTTVNRVWLARLLAVALVRLVKLRGLVICPNYVLTEDALEQDRKDLFIAHEIAQMIPVYGHAMYWQFREANPWVSHDLANANAPFYREQDYRPHFAWRVVKRFFERLLAGKIGDRLEAWEYRRKMVRFAVDMQSSNSAAQLDERHIKGHFNDYGGPVLQKYRQRLHENGLDKMPLAVPAPGD